MAIFNGYVKLPEGRLCGHVANTSLRVPGPTHVDVPNLFMDLVAQRQLAAFARATCLKLLIDLSAESCRAAVFCWAIRQRVNLQSVSW